MSETLASTSLGQKFYLFGYPIAHSAAPAFSNYVFNGLKTSRNYSLYSTSKITPDVMALIRANECGGCAVTMPNKTSILAQLDEITPESKVTNAVNTIVKVPTGNGSYKLVGTNTDILGVRNALLRALPPSLPTSYPTHAGLVIGGGATTRSAAHALTLLGLSPIYLINRDDSEVQDVINSMPHLSFIHLRNPVDVEEHLVGQGKKAVLMAVGCIPAITPQTLEERMVYTTISAFLTVPYVAAEGLPLKRLFLEMPYKPRRTPILQMAEALGWTAIVGVQAVIEQGLAQQRMWLTSNASIDVGSDASLVPKDVDEAARKFVEEMQDVIVTEKEIDKATQN
ncbi:hypothetical protein C8J56DRAFT_1006758 [Mycena floridula]|nr:hypothetical protein C8J56DRAFT_1006758 [Mycena floridula]